MNMKINFNFRKIFKYESQIRETKVIIVSTFLIPKFIVVELQQ